MRKPLKDNLTFLNYTLKGKGNLEVSNPVQKSHFSKTHYEGCEINNS